MKTAILLFIAFSQFIFAQPDFYGYFKNETLRIDYCHGGDSQNENISLDKLYQYGGWAGSHINLADNFDNGAYYYKVLDKESGILLYSSGFDSYFREYQASSFAKSGVYKVFHESALIPFPQKIIIFNIEKRNRKGGYDLIFSTEINPDSIGIVKGAGPSSTVILNRLIFNGAPEKKLDILFLGEGYAEFEINKFNSNLIKFANVILNAEPFSSRRSDINIYGALKPSEMSGADEPRAGIYRNTSLGCSYNSLGSERYLLTEDNKSLRDIASAAPYDALIIMVNSERYGGGGIYNFYCTFAADNPWAEYLLLHEFGHSFGGLADEYYTSSVAYEDFYSPGVEPSEPNITAQSAKDKIKWASLIDEDTPTPTPWQKNEFEKLSADWGAVREKLNNRILSLKKKGAPQAEIQQAMREYQEADSTFQKKITLFLRRQNFYGRAGAFEGAGYVSEGMYRPMADCIMFSKGLKPFCKVCNRAVLEKIDHYAK